MSTLSHGPGTMPPGTAPAGVTCSVAGTVAPPSSRSGRAGRPRAGRQPRRGPDDRQTRRRRPVRRGARPRRPRVSAAPRAAGRRHRRRGHLPGAAGGLLPAGARTLVHQFGAPMYGDDVATLQSRLQDLGFYTGLVDGYFGLQTHNGLMSYQREYGLAADGICGPETLRSPVLPGFAGDRWFAARHPRGGVGTALGSAAVREADHHRPGPRRHRPRPDHQRPGRPDQRVGHPVGLGKSARGPDDRDRHGDLPVPARGPQPLDTDRAATANTVGADLMISLRCETQTSPSANGVASFYFGSSHGSVSTIGRNLADFIQREVVARTGLRDCRTHGRTWDLLRLTRMPTVQVDVGYITSPRDRGMLVTRRPATPSPRASWPRSSACICWARTTGRPERSPSPSCSRTSCRSSRPAGCPASS